MNHTLALRAAATLEGQLLVAMPTMADDLFARSVVYLCAHSEEGAMGLIVNKPVGGLTFSELMHEIDFEVQGNDAVRRPIVSTVPPGRGQPVQPHAVLTGGPVETTRGFVLHTADYQADDSTVRVGDGLCLTATLDILQAIAQGRGPQRALLALGYSGWAPGQLEDEIRANGWLHCPADADIVLGEDHAVKYEKAFARMGIDPSHLVNAPGRA